jgi:hypothetical protein
MVQSVMAGSLGMHNLERSSRSQQGHPTTTAAEAVQAQAHLRAVAGVHSIKQPGRMAGLND